MADGEKLPSLKPCPFCGGAAKFEFDESEGPLRIRAACSAPCSKPVAVRRPYERPLCFAKTGWFNAKAWSERRGDYSIREVTIEEVANEWNTRVEVSRG